MRVHYTGRKASISDKQKQKLQVKFDKIDRILSPKDSLEAHVILSRQRHLCEAEATLPETTRQEQKLRRRGENSRAQVIRSRRVAPKPLTVEEAVIELDDLDRDQITFRDAESGAMRVLLRLRDGDLELVEAG